ncbi:hypothetical protein [Bremerella sp.]|uniref:hypothetical protein n=1 Tax=Bremerella sp. TaxID=2795602 RepID=UPI00391BA9BF
MVDEIENRLIDGQFYEQFKDQLSMTIRLDPKQMAKAADVASRFDKEYIRRYPRLSWLVPPKKLDSVTQIVR